MGLVHKVAAENVKVECDIEKVAAENLKEFDKKLVPVLGLVQEVAAENLGVLKVHRAGDRSREIDARLDAIPEDGSKPLPKWWFEVGVDADYSDEQFWRKNRLFQARLAAESNPLLV